MKIISRENLRELNETENAVAVLAFCQLQRFDTDKLSQIHCATSRNYDKNSVSSWIAFSGEHSELMHDEYDDLDIEFDKFAVTSWHFEPEDTFEYFSVVPHRHKFVILEAPNNYQDTVLAMLKIVR